jgi:hypothetical protein
MQRSHPVFGVFADDDEVDVLRSLSDQRTLHAREQLHRAQIDVLIKLKPQFQQQTFFQNSRLHVRMAHRPQINGVELAKLAGATGWQRFARLEIPLAAPVELLRLELKILDFRDRGQDLECLSRHFRAGAVSGDHGNFKRRTAHKQ